MENIMRNTDLGRDINLQHMDETEVGNLTQAELDNQYIIKDISTTDLEMKDFLFTLGCYKGEIVTVISRLSENYVISVKDARYSIDEELAKAILI